MADRQGFEPWRRLPAYTLSKRAPSTTRPPVHWMCVILINAQGSRPDCTDLAYMLQFVQNASDGTLTAAAKDACMAIVAVTL